MTAKPEHFDVIIVGAGISGVGGAYHLKDQRPQTNYVVLEAQDDFGALNDAATVEHVLQRVLGHAGPEAGSDLREGVAFVAGWHQSRIEPVWQSARKRWKRLAKTDAFWRD